LHSSYDKSNKFNETLSFSTDSTENPQIVGVNWPSFPQEGKTRCEKHWIIDNLYEEHVALG